MINPLSVLTPRHLSSLTKFYEQYGDEIDEFGFNPITVRQWQPIFQFLFEEYFNVETLDIENVPNSGRAVLVGNHSGGLPIDAYMTCLGVMLRHPSPRRIRFLAHEFLRSNKVSKALIRGFGGVPATYATATKLLNNEELVFFYPEGAKGTGKPFSMRYRLCDFDPGFVKAAIETASPIIPVTTIGADEIYPLLGNWREFAKIMGTPYWPVTLTFPWLPLTTSCIPLPVKFFMKFGNPIYLDYPPERATDRLLRARIANEIQHEVQRELNKLLRARKSIFNAW